MKTKLGTFLALLALITLTACTGCKSVNLAPGGAYNPATTNAAGQVTLNAAPEQALYVADASYKLAYDLLSGVLKFERDNRAELAKISPKIKTNLDKIRPVAVDIDHRWALARAAYKANPTPLGLTTVQQIIAEIQRLIPAAQAELTPVYSSLNRTN